MAESAVAVSAARLAAISTLARHVAQSEHHGPFPWAALSITGRTATFDPGLLGPAVRTAAFTLSRTLRTSGL